MNQFLLRTLFMLFIGGFFGSCATSLKPYERQYINDPEMSMFRANGTKFQQYVNTIREGSLAAEGKKGSGGCGCN